MPSDVNVSADPILVYGMIGLLIGALGLALVFAWPRRGLGAATKADAAHTPPTEVWMPGGDIFGADKPPMGLEEPVIDPTKPTAAQPPWDQR